MKIQQLAVQQQAGGYQQAVVVCVVLKNNQNAREAEQSHSLLDNAVQNEVFVVQHMHPEQECRGACVRAG